MLLEIRLEDLSEVNPNICVVLRRDKLQEIRNRILMEHKSVRKFSKIVGCHPEILRKILIGKANPTFLLIRKIVDKLNLKDSEIISKVISSCKPRGSFIFIDSFPIKESPELASLVGHSFGDGHIGRNSFTFTNTATELINSVIDKVSKLPIKNISINERFHKAKTIGFPRLVRDILVVAGAPIGNKIKQPFKIPEWIRKGGLDIKKNFLQALFDDESTVQVNSREIILHMHKTIELIDNLHLFFWEIRGLLEELHINGATITQCHPHEGRNGKTLQKRLRTCGTFNFIRFQENIDFTHSHKKELLKELIENTRRLQLREGEAKKLIIDVLNSHIQLNTIEIANKLNLSQWCIWDHLRDLEKQNIVIRNKPSVISQPHKWSLNNKK